jgi:two-component system chemotaxis response regulator CheB
MVHFRCRVGHEYSPDGLLALQSETVEQALWVALRAMEERAEVSRRLATRARAWGHEASGLTYEDKATAIDESAAVIRGLLEAQPEPVEDDSGGTEAAPTQRQPASSPPVQA